MEIDVKSIFIYDNWLKIRQGPNKSLFFLLKFEDILDIIYE